MISIVMLGGTGNPNSFSFFRDILRRNYNVITLSERSFRTNGESGDFAVIELPALSKIDCKHPIILCSDPFAAPQKISIPPDAIGLLSSANRDAAAFIRQIGLRAMTFGMSSKDTLTLSSITADNAVLCLQRPICDIAGHTLEPVEIPIHLSRQADSLSILCAAAALILSGKIDSFDQIIF